MTDQRYRYRNVVGKDHSQVHLRDLRSEGQVMQPRAIDVICQHTRKGELIPIKLRIRDEEGEFQSYAIRSYRDLSHKGTYTMPNGIVATSNILPFDCKIMVFGQEKLVHLFYNSRDNIWRINM